MSLTIDTTLPSRRQLEILTEYIQRPVFDCLYCGINVAKADGTPAFLVNITGHRSHFFVMCDECLESDNEERRIAYALQILELSK